MFQYVSILNSTKANHCVGELALSAASACVLLPSTGRCVPHSSTLCRLTISFHVCSCYRCCASNHSLATCKAERNSSTVIVIFPQSSPYHFLDLSVFSRPWLNPHYCNYSGLHTFNLSCKCYCMLDCSVWHCDTTLIMNIIRFIADYVQHSRTLCALSTNQTGIFTGGIIKANIKSGIFCNHLQASLPTRVLAKLFSVHFDLMEATIFRENIGRGSAHSNT